MKRSSSFLAVLVGVWAVQTLFGCASGAGSLKRLDVGSQLETFFPTTLGGYTTVTLELPAPGLIRKIVVVPRQPLRRFQVQIRSLDGRWKTVTSQEGRFTQTITVSADVTGDAVRVVDRTPTKKVRSNPFMETIGGPVETILVYGLPLPPSVTDAE